MTIKKKKKMMMMTMIDLDVLLAAVVLPLVAALVATDVLVDANDESLFERITFGDIVHCIFICTTIVFV